MALFLNWVASLLNRVYPQVASNLIQGMAKKKCVVTKKRDIACFSKDIPEDRTIQFDVNNMPCGDLSAKFRSYYSMKVLHDFPYHIPMSEFPDKDFDELWLEVKTYWRIQTDAPKNYMKRWAIRRGTNFRSILVQKYVRNEENACNKYTFLDPNKWDDFVKEKTCKEFLGKSTREKVANAARKHTFRLGRSGWDGKRKKQDTIWPQLEASYPDLKRLRNKRSKLLLMGLAKENKETKLYELDDVAISMACNLNQAERAMILDGSYYQNKEDPIVRVLGPEHGGRSRTVSSIIGYTKVHGGLFQNVNNDRESVEQVDTFPAHGPSHRSDGRVDYPPIESHTQCELLINVGDSLVKVADGVVWPSTSTTLHCRQITEGCVKVSVDEIVATYKGLHVYNITKTDDIEFVEHLVHNIVQWPRYAIRLLSQGTPRMDSGCGSQSRRDVSPQVQYNDTVMTSSLQPQASLAGLYDDELYPDDFASYFQGGLVNALKSGNQHLHKSQPEPEPRLESELQPTPQSQMTLIRGLEYDNWEDMQLESCLKRANDKSKPGLLRDMLNRLLEAVGNLKYICHSLPDGMYPEPVQNIIPLSEMLRLFTRDWLDASVIHTFAMCLFESTPNSMCAILDLRRIHGTECVKNSDMVVKYINKMYTYHKDKRYFLVPYQASEHWSLLIIEPGTGSAYIVDSISREKTKANYIIADLFEKSFKQGFIWTTRMCPQQKFGWECGFMVLKHMWAFLDTIQHDFINKMWKSNVITTPDKLELMVVDLMKLWMKKVFDVAV